MLAPSQGEVIRISGRLNDEIDRNDLRINVGDGVSLSRRPNISSAGL
jgi:hypothetical protein